MGKTQVTRWFDVESSILHERFEQPGEAVFDLAYRLYSTDELRAMLTESGFEEIEMIDSALVPPPPTFMTAVARR